MTETRVVVPTFFQALDKKTTAQTKQKKISYFVSHLIFHRFYPFNCCLSVLLELDKGDYPENMQIVCVYVIINKYSFEAFYVFDSVSYSHGELDRSRYQRLY